MTHEGVEDRKFMMAEAEIIIIGIAIVVVTP